MFAGLLALPFSWAVGILVAATLARVAWSARHNRVRVAQAGPESAGSAISLGVDGRGRGVSLSAEELSAHALMVGASGAGKSTTMLRILTEQIAAGQPVVAIDLKGSPAFAATLGRAALQAGRELRIWTPDGPGHWNPLAHGNATELKDKLIGTERFTEPHYRRAAERYVQCALQVLMATGAQPDLGSVVALMDPRRLAALSRRLGGPLADHVQDYLGGLTGRPGQRGAGARHAPGLAERILSGAVPRPRFVDAASGGRAGWGVDRPSLRPGRSRGSPVQPQLESLRIAGRPARHPGHPGPDQRQRTTPGERGARQRRAGAGHGGHRRILGPGFRPSPGPALPRSRIRDQRSPGHPGALRPGAGRAGFPRSGSGPDRGQDRSPPGRAELRPDVRRDGRDRARLGKHAPVAQSVRRLRQPWHPAGG